MTQIKTPDRFVRSRRLVWACVCASIALAVTAIWRSTPEAAQIATVAIPSLIGAALGFAGVSNWAEVRRP